MVRNFKSVSVLSYKYFSFVTFLIATPEGGWVDGFTPESEMMSSPEMEDLEDISMDTSIGPEGKPPGKLKPTTTKHK